MTKNAIASLKSGHFRATFNDLPDSHVAEMHRKSGSGSTFHRHNGTELTIILVVRCGLISITNELGPVLGRCKFRPDANLHGSQRRLFVFPQNWCPRRNCDQLTRHNRSPS
jgi:hypothetical protein